MVKKTYGLAVTLLAIVLLAGCAKAPVASTDKKPFEGVIEYKVTYEDGYDYQSEGMPDRVVATFRGNKMMVAMKMGKSKIKIISDKAERSLTSIIYVNGRYTATLSDSTSQQVKEIYNLQIEPTEKLKKIADHRCIKANSQYGIGINAKPFSFYYTPELSNYNYFWHYGFADVKGILLKFVTYDFGVRAEFDATSVTPKTIDPYIFTLPPGTIIKR